MRRPCAAFVNFGGRSGFLFEKNKIIVLIVESLNNMFRSTSGLSVVSGGGTAQ